MLSHRGPDGEGFRLSPDRRLFLGHRRLKIIDLSDQSAQPMSTPDGRWTIIYNGEIMNYQTLRQELGDQWPWRTQGDTELLLALWALHGPACLDKLVGMFAFAIHDSLRHELTLVRDRFGIKPLYWCDLPGGGIAFASEIPPLLSCLRSVQPDEGVIRSFLEKGLYDVGSRTFFSKVRSLPPGFLRRLEMKKSSNTTKRWYSFRPSPFSRGSVSRAEIQERTLALLRQAVHDHMVSDVEVGLNVSGGVDSSLMIAIASQINPGIKLFCQDYEAPYDESRWVRQVAGQLSLHVAKLDEKNIREILPAIVLCQAEPFGSLFVAGFDSLYQAAEASRVTVLLDGNGIDEAFLGYKKYHRWSVMACRDVRRREKLKEGYARFWGAWEEGGVTADPSNWSIDDSIGVRPGAMSRRLAAVEEVLPQVPALDFSADDPARQQAAMDLFATKIPRVLRFNDRMSMKRSKELRVPFLDHRLVEFAFSIPGDLLLNERGTKALIRELAANLIPSGVAFAPKRSVQSPQREWLAGPWEPWIRELLTSRSFASRGWVDPSEALAIWDGHVKKPGNNSFFAWQWLSLELWARKFLD